MTETGSAADLKKCLEKAVAKRQVIHYLPVYRAEHRLKLLDWLDIKAWHGTAVCSVYSWSREYEEL